MSGTSVDTHVLSAISFQGMPNLGVPLVTENNTVGYAWYRFFVSIYNVTLAGLPILPAGVNAANPNSLTLASLNNQLITQNDQITTGAGAIKANTSSIATLELDVIDLQKQINLLQTQVGTLQTQMATALAEIAALQNQVDGFTVFGTSGSASPGAGGTLPAQVTGYMSIRLGQNLKIPLYLP